MTDNEFFEARLAEIRKLANLHPEHNLLDAQADYARISMMVGIYQRRAIRLMNGDESEADRCDSVQKSIDRALEPYGLHAEWPGLHPLLVDSDGISAVNLYLYNE